MRVSSAVSVNGADADSGVTEPPGFPDGPDMKIASAHLAIRTCGRFGFTLSAA